MVLLPVASTTTEAIAAYLLGGLMPSLRGESGLHRAELVLAEAADTGMAVRPLDRLSAVRPWGPAPCGATVDELGVYGHVRSK